MKKSEKMLKSKKDNVALQNRIQGFSFDFLRIIRYKEDSFLVREISNLANGGDKMAGDTIVQVGKVGRSYLSEEELLAIREEVADKYEVEERVVAILAHVSQLRESGRDRNHENLSAC